MTTHASGTAHLPSKDLYWALLDTTPVRARTRSRRQEQLRYLFETQLPVAIDQVHAVFVPLRAKNAVVACGIEKTALDAILKQQPGLTAALPEATPEWLSAPDVHNRLNFLVGRYEPPARKAARQKNIVVIAATALAISLVLSAGMHRRTRMLRQAAAQIKNQERSYFTDAFPLLEHTPSNTRAYVASQLNRLEQTRQSAGLPVTPDISSILNQLFEHWPNDVPLRTESLIVSDAQVSVTGYLDETAQIQSLRAAFADLSGWSLSQPRIDTTRDGIRVRISLTVPEGV